MVVVVVDEVVVEARRRWWVSVKAEILALNTREI